MAVYDARHDAEMAQLYKEGWSLDELGNRFGFSRTAVRKHLHRCGVKIRSPGGGKDRLPQEEIERTVFLYVECDLSIFDAGAVLGISGEAVQGRLERAGIPLRSPSEAAAIRARKRWDPRPLPELA